MVAVDPQRLMAAAQSAAAHAYAPYSHFSVGAAIALASGEIVTGCNVENASYGLTLCAERVALFKAVSEGYANTIVAMAVWAQETPDHGVTPCGACRQVMAELMSEDAPVYYLDHGTLAVKAVSAWLPSQFKLDH